MNDVSKPASVLVISTDTGMIEDVLGGNAGEQQIQARESIQDVLAAPELLENNGIIIFDLDTADNNVELATKSIIELKQSDPTQVLMVVGDREPLADLLKTNIQPMVYRAFNKPVSPNQLFLGFKSAQSLHQELQDKQLAGEDILVVGPAENRTSVDTLAAQNKTNPAIYAALGVVALGIVGWLVFGGSDEAQDTVIETQPAPAVLEAELSELAINENEAISQTNNLNQLASTAMLEGRFIAPAGDNALEYFNKVLLIDPYDSTAYEGKKSIALALRESYGVLVENGEFDRALKVINTLKRIEPLNVQNDEMHANLERSITAHVKNVKETGSSEEIARTTEVLAKIETEFASSKSASDALKAEQVLIEKIDAALDANNLIPPQQGNAYSLVSDALKGNTISKSNSDPRVKALSAKLLRMATATLADEKLEDTQKLSALVKRLNVDRAGLAALEKGLQEKLAAVAAEKANTAEVVEEEVVVAPAPPKIIPAKIISREPPRYPGRALKNDVEGWVDLSFTIDTKGVPTNVQIVNSEPAGIFDSSAIKSVKKWRFSPARNQQTGLPMESPTITTKVQFRLN